MGVEGGEEEIQEGSRVTLLASTRKLEDFLSLNPGDHEKIKHSAAKSGRY